MKKAFLLLHSAVFLAACSGILGNLISLDAVFITWYRMLFAAIMLLIIGFYRKSVRLERGDWKIFATGFLLALHWVMFYASIKYSNVSVGVVCFCLSGFFTALLNPLLNHKRISLMELMLSSMTTIGIILIFHFDNSFRTGIIFGVISAFLFACFAIFNGRTDTTGNVVKITAFQMTGGAVGLGAFLPLYIHCLPSAEIVPTTSDLYFLLLLAFGCTVCMCSLLNKAQKSISAFSVSLSFNLEPIYSIALAIILFREDRMLGTSFYVGLSLIAFSLLLQMLNVSTDNSRKPTLANANGDSIPKRISKQ